MSYVNSSNVCRQANRLVSKIPPRWAVQSGFLFTRLYFPSDRIIINLRHLNIVYKSYSANLKFGVPSDIMLKDKSCVVD